MIKSLYHIVLLPMLSSFYYYIFHDSWVNTWNFFCGWGEYPCCNPLEFLTDNRLLCVSVASSSIVGLRVYSLTLATLLYTPSSPLFPSLSSGQSSNWAVKLTKAERVVQIIIAIITTITSRGIEGAHPGLNTCELGWPVNHFVEDYPS